MEARIEKAPVESRSFFFISRQETLVNEKEWARARARYRVGTQGAASEVRKIDVASVDTAALLEQLRKQQKRAERRSAEYQAVDGRL